MNFNQTDTALFNRLRFVLVQTSHPGNIGAAARAMKTMGFSELVLVDPRFGDAVAHADAIAFASGAQDILSRARVVATIEEALHGCRFVAAVSARPRELAPPLQTPREFAATACAQRSDVALVFGSERYGLPNEIVGSCNALIHIPANPDYSSLNLAQAVQLLAYECRIAALGAGESGVAATAVLASNDEIEGMYRHLEQALTTIGFLKPDHPKKLMPRLRRLFARARLETEEVNIVRGIAKKILDREPGGEG